MWCGVRPQAEGTGLGGWWSDGADRPDLLRTRAPVGDGTRAPADRDQSGLDELADTVRLEHLQQGVELVGSTGRLDGDRVVGDVDGLGPEEVDDLEDLAAVLRRATDLGQDQLAPDSRRLELDDLEHLDQLVELLGELLEH